MINRNKYEFQYPLKKTGRLNLNLLERNDRRYLNDCQSTFQLAPRKCTKQAYRVWLPDININFLDIWIDTTTTNRKKESKEKERKKNTETNQDWQPKTRWLSGGADFIKVQHSYVIVINRTVGNVIILVIGHHIPMQQNEKLLTITCHIFVKF